MGTRLSTMATTGWSNWVHGELWLFEDGILRIPLGWIKSICLVGAFGEWRRPLRRAFSEAEFAALIAARRNLWIPRAAIARAVLRHTPASTDDLRLQLTDGRSLQLLTIQRNRIYIPLQSSLLKWLGDALLSDPPPGW
jgi:hypothetical protein